jgi:hypothetical protein
MKTTKVIVYIVSFFFIMQVTNSFSQSIDWERQTNTQPETLPFDSDIYSLANQSIGYDQSDDIMRVRPDVTGGDNGVSGEIEDPAAPIAPGDEVLMIIFLLVSIYAIYQATNHRRKSAES